MELDENSKNLIMQACEFQLKSLVEDHPEIREIDPDSIRLIFIAGINSGLNAFNALMGS